MMYIHLNVPLNLTALYDQADLFTSNLKTLQNTVYKRIPLTKAARDNGNYRLRRFGRIIKKLRNVDQNLPHVKTRQTREAKLKI
jgi:hypothetical protein